MFKGEQKVVALRKVLNSSFAGSWGENPSAGNSGNALVLRAVNLAGDGRICYKNAAPRTIPQAEVDRKRLKHFDLILEASGGGPGVPVGRVALYEDGDSERPYICSNFFRVLRPNQKSVYPPFLAKKLEFLYQSPDVWKYQQQTTGIVNLKLSDYLDQHLRLPSVSEQRRISSVLDAVTALEQKIEREMKKQIAVRKGLVEELIFSARCEEVVTLGDVAKISGGLTLGRELARRGSVDLPYLRVANVQDGYIDCSDVKKISIPAAEVERFKVQEGDLLLTEGGDIDKLGRGAVWDGSIDPCLHQNHIFRVRCSGLINPYYLEFYVSSSAGRSYFLSVAKQTTNLASINSRQLSSMPIPVPALSEQERVVRIIRRQNGQISRLRQEISKVRKMKQGLAKDLISDEAIKGATG
ncbi:restriction endonuclease subunit S [Streptomyces radiopugnans]|uniref:restriction endonuclease subunit S n=1 Tax=Streptomyces radiopugnans TaxID=403935 RepID=UPI003F1D6962